jgi:hypothetical protein
MERGSWKNGETNSKLGGLMAQPYMGKIVLIKVVLSSLTIFQCAAMLAPKGVLGKISRSI